MSQTPNFHANGNISPARFVRMDTTTPDNMSVLQAGANAGIIGVSTVAGREAPIPAVSTMYAAQAGDQINVHGLNEFCLLEAGGTVACGDELIADSDGKGVARATSGTTIQMVGAIALEAGSSGNLIRVQVCRYALRPALV